MRAAQKQVPAQRTVLGGRITPSRHPVVTQVIIGINVALFLLGYVVPGLTWNLMFAPVVGETEPWRIVTSGFLHAGIFHIAFNMYALWIVGPFLEKMLGRWRFIALYLLSLIGGSLAVVVFSAGPSADSWYQGVVGASGAVFGLFGAIALVLRKTGRNAQQILVVIGINVVISFVIAGISWQAHVGGLITGGVLGLLFTKLPRERQHVGGVIGVVAVAAALVAGFVAMYAVK
ncbi:rhomboid family intramembrane serine protease [Pseudactinotalea sp. HY158]|uniref:rhomboid family intramembrane serine protease n=1 Tax=Pseudactinotalea sp. HY158 TaxID=2654547 RepID=UPI001E536C15|nr:rhomboid family intramembrane serine protease [Pseudactinotalea sp. HY158]